MGSLCLTLLHAVGTHFLHLALQSCLGSAQYPQSWEPALSALCQLHTDSMCAHAGGELQRFAIAVVAAQQADIYMIDEPSSYLDVRQRLKAAQVISLNFLLQKGAAHGVACGHCLSRCMDREPR